MKTTKKQFEIYQYCVDHLVEWHSFPTCGDIAKHFKFKSTNAAAEHLRALAKRGLLEKYGQRYRLTSVELRVIF